MEALLKEILEELREIKKLLMVAFGTGRRSK